jgi:DNA-binding CsgD family transcriptional regulator
MSSSEGPAVGRCLACGNATSGVSALPAARRRPRLSVREQEVLIAWLHHESQESVARALWIAPSTVKKHIARVRGKYDAAGRSANTKTALLIRAIQDGLVDLAAPAWDLDPDVVVDSSRA